MSRPFFCTTAAPCYTTIMATQPSRTLVKQMFAELRPFRLRGQWWIKNPNKGSPYGPYLSRTEADADRDALAQAYANVRWRERGKK